jgi:hypothetical protein
MVVGKLSARDPYSIPPLVKGNFSPCKNFEKIIAAAAGAFIALGGLFLLLASLEILPHGMNAVSQLGLGSTIAGGIAISIGAAILCCSLVYSAAKRPIEDTKDRGQTPMDVVVRSPKDLVQSLELPAETKNAIVTNSLSPKSIKNKYYSLAQNRNIPTLCGYNRLVTMEQFALFMPGIAALAALLKRKYNLQNLWACRNLNVLQERLQEIQRSPHDQRHAFIVPTHSSLASRGRPKAVAWEQHKVAICVEKINGHLHIYLLEPYAEDELNGMEPNRINLDESLPFTARELVLAFIDSANLEKNTTSLYTPSIWRQRADGCSIFALKDALYFLRDDNFAKKLLLSKSHVELPKTGIDIQIINALPPEYMQSTQSLTTLESYQQTYPTLAIMPFGSNNKKTLQANLKKSIVDVQGHPQNHRITRNILKYQWVILELMNRASDSEIQSLVNETLI